MQDLVWYASYGSNLLRSRFLCYILGGIPDGTVQEYVGCTDKTEHKDDKQIIIPHSLYFSKSSRIWEDGGVAFIKAEEDENVKTLGRMYLITSEQFVQVVRQENGRSPHDSSIEIDIEKTIIHGESSIQVSWYSRIVYLGTEAGHPIFTFTGGLADSEIVVNAPGEKYLITIIRGIQETYELSDPEIVDYLVDLDGIQGRINVEKISKLVNKAENRFEL
jgi:hypothetical protein